MSLKTVAPQHLFSVKLKEWYSYIKIEKYHINALQEAINHENQRFLRKEDGERRGGNPYESKGALLYMVCDHVVRPTELPQFQHPNVEPGCVTCVPYKGLHPLRRFAAILAHLGNKQGSYEPYLFPKSFYPNLNSKEEHFYVSTKLRA